MMTGTRAPVGDLSLSVLMQLVPARVVSLICCKRYIVMCDLLSDNAAVREHFEEIHGTVGVQLLPVSSKPRVREVNSLPLWVCCFLTFLAVGTSDVATRDRLTYAVLLLREAMHHRGYGWMDYDYLFRQQAAIDPTLAWNMIHLGLQVITILSQHQTRMGTLCTLCQECNHVASHYAFSQLQQSTICMSLAWVVTPRVAQQRICSSWNDGSCIYLGSCSYRHICSNCFHPSHQARDCRAPPRAKAPPSSQPPASCSH